jgi:cytochrome c553
MRSARPGRLAALIVSVVPLVARAGGDLAAGKDKSLACQACHVSSATGGDIPHLAGQREAYIAKQLAAFRKGDRPNPIMSAIARQLSDADIENLAGYWASQPAGSDTTVAPAAAAIRKTHVSFPKDFPKGFTLYLTSNQAEKATVSKTYINPIGLQAARAGKPLPDGTVIVTVHHAAKLDAEKKPVLARDGSWAIHKIESYAVMESRAGWGEAVPELLRNANWNYALFGSDRAPRAEFNQAMCLGCHKPQAAVSYIFSFKELAEHASAK